MTDPAIDLGTYLVAQRAAGVAWKELQIRTGYGRTRLWMLWRAAVANKNVHEHLNNGQMVLGREL